MKNFLIKIDEFLGRIFGDWGIIDNIRYSIKPPKLIQIFNEELNRRNEIPAYQFERDLIWKCYTSNQIDSNELKHALNELNEGTMNRMLNPKIKTEEYFWCGDHNCCTPPPDHWRNKGNLK